MLRGLYRLLPFLPLLGVGVFIAVYASPTPLTDEWNFLHGAMKLSRARTLSEFGDGLVWYSYSHCVIVPFLVYVPIEFLTGFDSRALMLLTITCHVTMLVTVARRYSPPPLILFGLSLILFNPARYIELLWGFEFTLAMSIAFSVWGLFALSGARATEGEATFARRLVGCLVLFTLGVLSSAGGYFGFMAAIPLVALKRIRVGWKLAAVVVFVCAAYGLYALAVQPEIQRQWGSRVPLRIMSCAGAALLGSPAAITEFSFDEWSIVGGVVFLLSALTIAAALRLRLLDEAALAVGLIAYGFLAVSAIAVNRWYLANWHIQHILPTFAGMLGLAWLIWQRSARWPARLLCAAVVLTSAVGGVGWYYGFATGGPEFEFHAQRIEKYIATFDRDPGQEMPFPPMGPWCIDHEVTAFFRAVDHPVFERAAAEAR